MTKLQIHVQISIEVSAFVRIQGEVVPERRKNSLNHFQLKIILSVDTFIHGCWMKICFKFSVPLSYIRCFLCFLYMIVCLEIVTE